MLKLFNPRASLIAGTRLSSFRRVVSGSFANSGPRSASPLSRGRWTEGIRKFTAHRIRPVAQRAVDLGIAIRPPGAKDLGGAWQDNFFHVLLLLVNAHLRPGKALSGHSYRTNTFRITAAQCQYGDDKTNSPKPSPTVVSRHRSSHDSRGCACAPFGSSLT